jgi:large subunit ribosomal protein L1
MKKHGKKFAAASAQIAVDRVYTIEEAIPLVQKVKFAKFDETVDMSLRLGVDPKHADQMVRGTVVLPHGLGRSKRVLAIVGGEKRKPKAGADVVGGEEMVDKIRGGFMDFDAVVATPDMMRAVGKLGKVLGPRGLMPNPKTGTVTVDIAKAVREIKAGRSSSASTRPGSSTRQSADVVRGRFARGQRPRAGRDRQGEAGGGKGEYSRASRCRRRWDPASASIRRTSTWW